MTCDNTYENLKDLGRLGLIPSEVQTKMDLSANSLVECGHTGCRKSGGERPGRKP